MHGIVCKKVQRINIIWTWCWMLWTVRVLVA